MCPVYAYQCPECKKEMDAFRKIDFRHDCPDCECGAKTEKIIARANINPDIFDGYLDHNLHPMHEPGEGTWVKSRQHRKDLMKEFGLTEIG